MPAPATGTTPSRALRWRKAFRAITTEYEPLYFYSRATRVEDIDALMILESLHDPSLKSVGDVQSVLPYLRVVGPGAEYIMTPFVYPDPHGTRFAPPGGPGAYYAANGRETALREKGYRLEQFLRNSTCAAGAYEFAVLRCAINAKVADVTNRESFPELCHITDYTSSQKFALSARAGGFEGVIYESVRNAGGYCVAIFVPKRVAQCSRMYSALAHFDGERVTRYSVTAAMVDS